MSDLDLCPHWDPWKSAGLDFVLIRVWLVFKRESCINALCKCFSARAQATDPSRSCPLISVELCFLVGTAFRWVKQVVAVKSP